MPDTPILKVKASDNRLRKEAQKEKLAILAEKKRQGKLTINDLDAKMDIIIEMLIKL